MNERVPDSDLIEELARFWDIHDATDFTKEFEEVAEPTFERTVQITSGKEVEGVEDV